MWNDVPVFIGKGDAAIALFRSAAKNAARPQGSGILHFALWADRRNFLTSQRELTSRGIAFHFQDHEISHSIYFDDPDGHKVEITTYEVS
jgi:catechol-2,3-dioxygenase